MSFFKKFWEKIAFSPLLQGKTRSRQIAYLGLLTAVSVVANSFFEFRLMDTQFSFTIVASVLIGALVGGVYGFFVCFLGDLIGFMMNSSGYAYMPWIGLAMGGTAFFAGTLINLSEGRGRYALTGLVCLLSFVVCSVGINTTAFYILYAQGGSYWAYFVARFIVKGQLFNCLFNYALCFLGLPLLKKILSLK